MNVRLATEHHTIFHSKQCSPPVYRAELHQEKSNSIDKMYSSIATLLSALTVIAAMPGKRTDRPPNACKDMPELVDPPQGPDFEKFSMMTDWDSGFLLEYYGDMYESKVGVHPV